MTTTVTTTNLIQGPASIWWGAFGVTEPASLATEPGTGWTDCGATDGGIDLVITDTYSVLTVDQLIYEAGRRRTARTLGVKTSLAEATLANLALAMNNTAPASNALVPDDGLSAFAPTYGAILVDGIAPGGFRRRFILRKTLSTDAITLSSKKDAKGLIPVNFMGHWVSSSIKPFVLTDATS